jgi:hypothetical protein
MPVTSLGRVSNSASRSFTNARGTIANVNYGKIVGSYDNTDLAFNAAQIAQPFTVTVNLAVTNNTPCNDLYGGGCDPRIR